MENEIKVDHVLHALWAAVMDLNLLRDNNNTADYLLQNLGSVETSYRTLGVLVEDMRASIKTAE